MKKSEFHYLCNLPLKEKIKKSIEYIEEFLEGIEIEGAYISCSFGKDSLVLTDLVRSVNEDIPIIYINTGVEHPSCVSLSKKYKNVYTVTPKKDMKKIIDEYGYITPYGKEISGAIEQVRRNLYEGNCDTYRVKQFRGEIGYNYVKFTKDLLAPFKISDKCCYHLKISPLKRFCTKYGFDYSFVGVTYDESKMREKNIIKGGINTSSQCRPLGFWTSNDVLQYLIEKKISLPSCYGDIIKKNGVYTTSLHKRNGCICCPVGAHLDNPNKFQLLKEENKSLYNFVINELNFKKVLDWFNIEY